MRIQIRLRPLLAAMASSLFVAVLALSACSGNSSSSDGGDGDGAGPDGGQDGGDGGDGGSDGGGDELPAGPGHVTYHYAGHLYRIADEEGASPEDLSQALQGFTIGSGEDRGLNLSADGQWLILSSERFHADCQGWACLVRAAADLLAAEPILAGGAAVHPEGFYAIASGGDAVIFAGNDGPNAVDLYLVRRQGGSWSAPQAITGASSQDFNDFPAIHPDGARVVFNCGPASFGDGGICEVGLDGNGFREVIMPGHVPPGMPGRANGLHHPHYAPDGSIVFEGDWDGERIWRLPAGAAEPEIISTEFTNDNSPCVLPSGRVVSLWLNRPGNPDGYHELKTMSADGQSHVMLVTGVELDDWGLGCGL